MNVIMIRSEYFFKRSQLRLFLKKNLISFFEVVNFIFSFIILHSLFLLFIHLFFLFHLIIFIYLSNYFINYFCYFINLFSSTYFSFFFFVVLHQFFGTRWYNIWEHIDGIIRCCWWVQKTFFQIFKNNFFRDILLWIIF